MKSRHIFRAIFFALSSMFASVICAQTERDPEKITFGIGVDIYPSVLAGDLQGKFQAGGLANFIVPIQIGPHIFIEPELGYYHYSADQTLKDSVKEHYVRAIVRTGFGVFYSMEPDKNFEYYLGGRLGILSSELKITHAPLSSTNPEFDHQWGAFYAGAALGLEYFISSHFSIGGEFQVNHIGYGAPIIDANPYTVDDSAQSVWSTNVSISARFFF